MLQCVTMLVRSGKETDLGVPKPLFIKQHKSGNDTQVRYLSRTIKIY